METGGGRSGGHRRRVGGRWARGACQSLHRRAAVSLLITAGGSLGLRRGPWSSRGRLPMCVHAGNRQGRPCRLACTLRAQFKSVHRPADPAGRCKCGSAQVGPRLGLLQPRSDQPLVHGIQRPGHRRPGSKATGASEPGSTDFGPGTLAAARGSRAPGLDCTAPLPAFEHSGRGAARCRTPARPEHAPLKAPPAPREVRGRAQQAAGQRNRARGSPSAGRAGGGASAPTARVRRRRWTVWPTAAGAAMRSRSSRAARPCLTSARSSASRRRRPRRHSRTPQPCVPPP